MEIQTVLCKEYKQRLDETRKHIADLIQKITTSFFQCTASDEQLSALLSCEPLLWKIHHLRGDELIHLHDLVHVAASLYVVVDLRPKRGKDKRHTWYILPLSELSPMRITHRGLMYTCTVKPGHSVSVRIANQKKSRIFSTFGIPRACGPHARIILAKNQKDARDLQNFYSANDYILKEFSADSAKEYLPSQANA